MNIKTKLEDGWEKTKKFVVKHKTGIILGSAAVVANVVIILVGSLLCGQVRKKDEQSAEENQGILERYDDPYEVFEKNDRYVIDRDLIDLLPAGKYDVFDMYENERVDYVVEGKESMET